MPVTRAGRFSLVQWTVHGVLNRGSSDPVDGVVLALDVGEKRIGVAVSDELGLLASPRTVIHRRTTQQALDEIARLLREVGPCTVVVGLPVSLDGQLHGQAQTVRRFAERLRSRIGVPLVYVDETLSTVRAEEQLRAAGVRPDRIRERIDAVAAAVILEDYLEQQRRAARHSGGSCAPDGAADGGGESGIEGRLPE